MFLISNALFLSQSFRLLIHTNSKQYGHVKYWMGLQLREYFPDMAVGPHAELNSPFFQHMRLLLVEGLVLGDFNSTQVGRVTANSLYEEYTSSFPPPKVMFKFAVNWQLVWNRLASPDPVLDTSAREFLFMIVNNIVPNRERLSLKMNLVNSPNCSVCNIREDNTHLCTECVMVRESWGWARLRLLSLLPDDCAHTSNFEMLNLMFAEHVRDLEVVWLIGTLVEFIWTEKILRKRKLE